MQRVERIYYNHTAAALEDELLYLLSSKNECDVILDEAGRFHIHVFHPYLNQAEGSIYKINLYETPYKFVIRKEDIPEGLTKALQAIGKVAMKQVITEVVRRLYESVDSDYFHTNGIYGKTPWRISK